MSCAYGTKKTNNNYLYSSFYSSIKMFSTSVKTITDENFRENSTRKCRKSISFYPSFTPVLSALSQTTSVSGQYSFVRIYGLNYLPNGTTFIQFGIYGYLPVIYYSSFNLSFIVPLNAKAGDYDVKVVNVYNGNFSPEVNQSYTGNLNYSVNSITYTLV